MARPPSARRIRIAALLVAVCACAACASLHRAPRDPAAEDQRITDAVLRIIADIDELVAEDLRVETRDGVVVISGVQESLAGIGDLLQRAGRIRGVAEVVNRIRIVHSGSPGEPQLRGLQGEQGGHRGRRA